MPVIYCLFSTADGQPRYIGQTTKPVDVRLDQHLREASRRGRTALHHWIQSTLGKGFRVRAHVLQLQVQPADLDLFEGYWISQFPDLLNDQRGVPRIQTSTKIGLAVERALQNRLSSQARVTAMDLPTILPD